jgi:Holliday junction DNA helicase RuvB
MEDFKIDIIIGEGASARNITLPIKPFTLIGATTRMGLISAPLRTRFGIPLNLEFYKPESLKNIVAHAAGKLHILSQEESNLEIAKRSRGTPRIAIRLLRRVRDFSYVLGNPSDDYTITPKIVKESLEQLGVDESGLDIIDLKYLNLLLESYNGGPAGIDTIAASLSEDRGTIEDTVESYLLQIGFIAKTPRGRMLTPLSFKYLGVKTPQITTENNTELF